MKGLELCERYYRKVGEPAFREAFPQIMERAAVGLAGEGSECMGYDDEISRDHDFGPSFIVWVSDEDYAMAGEELCRLYESLPGEFMEVPARQVTPQGGGRVGILRRSDFYRRYTGCPEGPTTTRQWMAIPEQFLAKAVNGKVFSHGDGEFDRVRQLLLSFYPEEVRRKKLAARAVTMAQSGQYNYPRALRRGDEGAAYLAMKEFVPAAMSMVHLLEKRYTPYYKWTWRSFLELPSAQGMRQDLLACMTSPLAGESVGRIESLCHEIRLLWKSQGLPFGQDDYLEPLAWELYREIRDPDLRNRHITDG